MTLSGKKLIKINITIPWEATMMDTYDYARECINQLKGGTDIPDMKLSFTVERVEENNETKEKQNGKQDN